MCITHVQMPVNAMKSLCNWLNWSWEMQVCHSGAHLWYTASTQAAWRSKAV